MAVHDPGGDAADVLQLTLNGDGSVTVAVPANAPIGYIDEFTCTVGDGHGGTDTVTVTVEVTWGLVASGPAPAGQGAVDVGIADLQPLIAEARARWEAAGVNTRSVDASMFQLADMNGQLLAVAGRQRVLIDRDAAGFGWFVDASPGDDREFRRGRDELVARRNGEASGRMDLLTAVMHEMGHLLGIDHSERPDNLMFSSLEAGVRRTPEADGGWQFLAPINPPRRLRAIDAIFADFGS